MNNKVTNALQAVAYKEEITGDQAAMILDLSKVFRYTDAEFEKRMQEFCINYVYDGVVGCECFYSINPEWKFIISRIYRDGNKFFFDGIDKDGVAISGGSLNSIEKTGNYYPIKKFLGGTFE